MTYAFVHLKVKLKYLSEKKKNTSAKEIAVIVKHSRCLRRVDPPLLVLSQSLFSLLLSPSSLSPTLSCMDKKEKKKNKQKCKKLSLLFFRPQEKLYKSP